MENKNSYKLPINYGSESVYIALECRNYLFENNFFENEEVVNIELLETALINYSVIKLSEWNPNYENIGIEDWDDLSALLEALNNEIPTQEEKEGFFNQYTWCILKAYSSIKRHPEIKWTKVKDPLFAYTYRTDNGVLKEFMTGESIPPHKVPLKLLDKVKSYYPVYPKKRNPVLQK